MSDEITLDIAKKVLETVDAGLVKGMGVPTPGLMCIEAAVCFALDLPHSDNPPCVANAVRTFKIVLNDSNWSGNAARAKGMRRIALVQLGTRDTLDEVAFVQGLALLAKKWAAAAAARYAAARYAAARAAARTAARTAASYADDAASYAAAAAARAAARTAARTAASYADDAARYAAAAARTAADAASYVADAVADAARDKVLSDCAEDVVQLLVQLGSPGAQWLYLTE